MKKETFVFAEYRRTNLPAYLWTPDGEVKAVLQITHGMTEHMGRYEAFAEYLVPQGIAVAGFDLRGHGRNPGNPEVASFGEGGWAASIEICGSFMRCCRSVFRECPTICWASHWGRSCCGNT